MNSKGPLGLPEGTVRAILAILIVAGTIAYLIVYKNLPEALVGIAGIIVGHYFGTRQGETIGQAKEIINYTKNGGANGNGTCTDTTTGEETIRR